METDPDAVVDVKNTPNEIWYSRILDLLLIK